MPVKVCLHCGDLHPLGQQCPRAPRNATSWNGTRDRAEQARFRRRVLKAAGNRCQFIQHGRRCAMTTSLQAHHMPDGTGVCLCQPHHKLLDAHAR